VSPVNRPSRPRAPRPRNRPGRRPRADRRKRFPLPDRPGLSGAGGRVIAGAFAGVEGRFLTARAGPSIVDS